MEEEKEKKKEKKKKKKKNKNKMEEEKEKKTLWSIIAKNTDCSTGPPARPFVCSLAPLTRSLALDCSLRSCPPLRSLIRSLAHFAHSLARGKVYDFMSQNYLVLNHSAS